MKFLKNLSVIAFVYVTFCLLAPEKSYAYIDPGTGSYILQVIAAVFIGALFSIKMFWRNVKLFFAGIFTRNSKDDDDEQSID
jgi:hypothetical protein